MYVAGLDRNSTKKTTTKYSKVKKSGSKIKLLNSKGKVVKTVTFNKKKGVLTYKGKRIKKVTLCI